MVKSKTDEVEGNSVNNLLDMCAESSETNRICKCSLIILWKVV